MRGWRGLVTAAATLGAVIGALPGAVVMTRATAPAATLLAGGALLLSSAMMAALLAAWTANLGLDAGRSKLLPLFLISLGVGALVAASWVALVASGAWARAFPFPPYFGIVGFSLLQGALVGFVSVAHRESFDWDGLDVASSLAWAAVPPALILLVVRVALA